MSTTTNGKAKTFSLNGKKTGVEVRVGDGSVPRLTLTKSDVATAANLLGYQTDYDQVCVAVSFWESQAKEASARADAWKVKSDNNLDDLNATKRDLTTLRTNFYAALAEHKEAKGAANVTIAMLQDSLRRAKVLGWIQTVAAMVLAMAGYIALEKYGVIGGVR